MSKTNPNNTAQAEGTAQAHGVLMLCPGAPLRHPHTHVCPGLGPALCQPCWCRAQLTSVDKDPGTWTVSLCLCTPGQLPGASHTWAFPGSALQPCWESFCHAVSQAPECHITLTTILGEGNHSVLLCCTHSQLWAKYLSHECQNR